MTIASFGMGKGIGWGGLAATLALMLQIPLLQNDPVTVEALAALPASLFILVFTTILVAMAALVVGLPIVALCEWLGCAGSDVLATAGSVAGLGTIWAIVLASDGAFGGVASIFAIAAMAGGGVMGGAWGHARETLADAEEWEAVIRKNPAPDRQHDRRWLR